MKISDIYSMSHPLVARARTLDGAVQVEDDEADYTASVPQLVNALTIEQASLAKIYAEVSGAEAGFSPQKIGSIGDLFPLPERFTPAAVYYIAEKLSYKNSYEAASTLHKLYLEEIEKIRRELPAVAGGIAEVY